MVKSFFALAIRFPSNGSGTSFQPLDQLHRRGGRAHLTLMNDVGEHIARLFRGRCGIDARQI
jgi:hypothetical protein